MSDKVNIEKKCNSCKNAVTYGLHCVKIECPIKKIEMFGYSGKNEYRVNAKDCDSFEYNDYGSPLMKPWSNELQKSVDIENVNWV